MKKIRLAILAFGCCLLIFSACGGGSGAAPGSDEYMRYSAAESYDNAQKEAYTDYAEGEGGYSSITDVAAIADARKVVTSAEFRVRTDDFNGTMRRLEQKIATSGSYVQQSYSNAATEYRSASASMTVRIPAAMYGDFKSFITDLAEIVTASEQGEDVTVQYYDTEARLKVLQAQAERVRSFIENSKNLEEIFTIERELARINTEIEQLTTVKNRLDNLVSYATVYIEISEGNVTQIEPVNFGEKVDSALKGSLGGLITAGQSLLLMLIWCWPVLLLILVTFPLWRKLIKRRKRKEEGENDRT